MQEPVTAAMSNPISFTGFRQLFSHNWDCCNINSSNFGFVSPIYFFYKDIFHIFQQA